MTEVTIRINSAKWDRRYPRLQQFVLGLGNAIASGGGRIIFQNLQARTPVRTGTLRNTETLQIFGNQAIVRTNAGYGDYVNDGIGPSPGRYVPALGKRIKTGMHPGFAGRHFKEKAIEDSRPQIIQFVKDTLSKIHDI